MRETLRKLDEVIERLRREPDNLVSLSFLELVQRDLMERINQRTRGRRAAVHTTPFPLSA